MIIIGLVGLHASPESAELGLEGRVVRHERGAEGRVVVHGQHVAQAAPWQLPFVLVVGNIDTFERDVLRARVFVILNR